MADSKSSREIELAWKLKKGAEISAPTKINDKNVRTNMAANSEGIPFNPFDEFCKRGLFCADCAEDAAAIRMPARLEINFSAFTHPANVIVAATRRKVMPSFE